MADFFSRKSSLQKVDRQNRTPLLAAVFYQNTDIVEFLFKEYVKEQGMIAVGNMLDCEKRNIIHVGVLSKNKSLLKKVVKLLDKSIVSDLIKSGDIKGKLNP